MAQGTEKIGGKRPTYVEIINSSGDAVDPSAPTIGAGESHIGEVGTPGDVVAVTLSVDTSAYADGDVLADFQEVTNFVRTNGGRALIQSLTVLDKDDQGVAMDIFTTPSAISLGTENSAPSITDTNAEGVQCVRPPGNTYSIEASDYKDLGGCKLATVSNIGLLVEALGTTGHEKSIYIGAITRGGTPTYSASGLILRFGLLWL
jgi:hypothetical protein